jgi:outer membrane protein assembly factor BamA
VGFPVAFYTPETGFGGGLAAGYIFPRRGERHPSSVMGISFYTEKDQSLIALAPELYLEGGFHGLMEVGYQKFPDSYWGIGPDTEDGDEEKYTPELAEARLIGELEFYPGLRAGLQFRYVREVILETEEGGQLEDRTIPGSTGGTTAGAGILGTYDSRDNRFSSSTGWYVYLSHTTYGRALLSDHSYTSIMLDVRKFFPVLGSHVFATRLYSRSTSGTVPFQELPCLGGQSAMRGYQAGRYRDKFAAYAQAEYRVPFLWVTSLAVFGSAGSVSSDIGSFSINRMKYAGGGGIRFRLNRERFSLRFDYAVTGEGGSNFYVSANEAF